MRISEALAYGESLLGRNGIEQPRWNAERILMFVLKIDRAGLYSRPEAELQQKDFSAFQEFLEKRARHCPLAYIEGCQEFWGIVFHVSENVLIPRPETELIIEAALKLPLGSAPFILDLGSGSGNIAVSLALELRDARVIALEKSRPAIEVLKLNSRQEIAILCGDMFHPPFLPESFDLITSNPPYVEKDSLVDLPPETRWEPAFALVTESLEQTYESLIRHASFLLRPGGYLIFEIGFEQGERIRQICGKFSDMKIVKVLRDQQGIERTFVLRKRGLANSE